jgi:hypothetical protein
VARALAQSAVMDNVSLTRAGGADENLITVDGVAAHLIQQLYHRRHCCGRGGGSIRNTSRLSFFLQ